MTQPKARFLYRVKREKASLAAAGLLAAMVLACSAISARSRATIDTTITNNGRGIYDLLVTAGLHLGSAVADHAGLIETNFAGLDASGGISAEQLAAIRAIPGVEVAAPLAFAGQITSPGYGVLVGAHDPDGAASGFFTEQPKVFDIGVQVTTSDGVQTQTLSTAHVTMVMAREGTGHFAHAILAAPGAESADTYNLSADITIPGVPPLTSGLIAVDPVAEVKLLGSAGKFLDPLIAFDRLTRTDAGVSSLASLVPDRFALERANLLTAQAAGVPIPLIVSDSAYAKLTATVSVTPVDIGTVSSATVFSSTNGAPPELTAAGQALIQDGSRGATHTTTYDLTDRVTPFAEPDFTIALPGASPPQGAADTSDPGLLPLALSPPSFGPAPARAGRPPPGGTGDLAVRGQGYVTLPGTTITEQTYRPSARILAHTSKPYLYAPLGTYHPGDVTGTAASASYVPLGTYAAGSATVRRSGKYDGARLGPSFSGRGLEAAPPGGITTLRTLRELEPTARIDVARVRVAGPKTYTPAMINKIDDVAARIADLGLGVRVVSGSSLTPVNIFVPHFFATPGGSPGADLGWVQEEWTSIGAAVRIERANLSATAWLLGVTLLAIVVLAAAVQGLALDGRRREAAFLVQLGWRRRRVAGWFLAEGSLGLALVVAASLISLILGSGSALSVAASAAAVVLFALLVVGAAWLAARPPATARPRGSGVRPRAARTPRAVGLQAVRGHPAAATMTVVALAVLGLTTVAYGAVLAAARKSSGMSRLANLVNGRLFVTETTLAALSLLASAALFAAGLSLLHRAISPQLNILSVSGWRRRELASLMRATVIRPVMSALLFGGAITIGLAWLIDQSHWWQLSGAGVGVMILVSVIAVCVVSRGAVRVQASTMTFARETRDMGSDRSVVRR